MVETDEGLKDRLWRKSLPMHFGHKEANTKDSPNLVPLGMNKARSW